MSIIDGKDWEMLEEYWAEQYEKDYLSFSSPPLYVVVPLLLPAGQNSSK